MADKPDSKNDTTKVLPCTCIHPFQDERYGVGNRLHNYAKNHPNKTGGWRCSVCGKERG